MDFAPLVQIAKVRSSTDPAHDFLHVERVLHNAERIAAEVPVNLDIVTPAILLHELFNYPKGHPDSHLSGDVCAEAAREVLLEFAYPRFKLDRVLECIRFHSFSRGVVPDHMEGKIVQDADRLDAIGAVGVARLFATCAQMGTPFYHAVDPFAANRALDDKQYGLDHFYKKLFVIADSMHTEPARRMARARTEFMEHFVHQFGAEIRRP